MKAENGNKQMWRRCDKNPEALWSAAVVFKQWPVLVRALGRDWFLVAVDFTAHTFMEKLHSDESAQLGIAMMTFWPITHF